MKYLRASISFLAGLIPCVVPISGTAQVLVNDPFSDGSRTNTSGGDPLGTTYWRSTTSPTVTLAVSPDSGSPGIGSGNALLFTPDGGFQKYLANFTLVTLPNPGDTLRLAFNYRFTTAPAGANDGWRMGLFNSNATRQTADLGSTSTRNDDKGYLFTTNAGAVATNSRVQKEDAGDDILGGSALGGIAAVGSSVASIANDTASHSMLFQITRMTNGDLQLRGQIDGTTAATGTATGASVLTYAFDEFAIGFGATGAQAPFYVDNLTVTKLALPLLDITAANAAEVGASAGSFTFTRTTTVGALTASYAVGGTATGGDDYTTLSGTVSFADGQASATIPLQPKTDWFIEGNETVIVTLATSEAYGLQNSTATVTITDDATATIINDTDFFAAINLDYPGLSAVKTAVQANDYATAKTAFASYLRARTTPLYTTNTFTPDATKIANALQHKYTLVGTTYDFEPEPVTSINWSYNATSPINNEWTWQFNRHDWWDDLAQATQSNSGGLGTSYGNELVFEINDWIATSNVPVSGWNNAGSRWRSIEAGLRTSSIWPSTFYRMKGSSLVSDALLVKWVKSFYEHGKFLEDHWSTSGNWVGIESRGLFTTGAIFPEFHEAAGWRALAITRAEGLLLNDVFPDGAEKELSPGYHDNVIGDIEGLKNVATLNSLPTSQVFDERLASLYDYELYVSEPNRRIPIINDSWNVNVSGRLAGGFATFPARTDYQWISTNGASGTIPSRTSHLFPNAGQAVMRSGWTTNSNYLLMDAGPFGTGHQHEDKLSINVDGYGTRHIIDCGPYDYDTSAYRTWSLKSHANSQPLIDDLDQNRAGAGNAVKTDAQTPVKWLTSSRFDYAAGTYGATSLEGWGPSRVRPAISTRHVFFVKPDWWVVIDAFAALDASPHTYSGVFHCSDDNVQSDAATQRITVQLVPGEFDPYSRTTISAGNTKPSLTITPLVAGAQTLEVIEGQDLPNPIFGFQMEKDTTFKKQSIPSARYNRTVTGDTQMAYVLAAAPASGSPRTPVVTREVAAANTYGVRAAFSGNAAEDTIFLVGLDGSNTSWAGTTYTAPALVVQDGVVYQWLSPANPTIAITAPADNSYTPARPVSITVSAADSDGTVTKVEFFDGAAKIGESTVAPFTFSWANPPSGAHVLTARATDAGGNFTTSEAVDLSVGPTVSISATAATASEAPGNTGAFTLTRDTTVGTTTVNYSVSGTAVAGLDYPALTRSVSFASGEAEKVISIAPFADFFRDPGDTVIVTLSPNTNYLPGTDSATVMINDTTTTPFSVLGKNPLATTPGGYGTTRSVVSVTSQSFDKALRIVTADSSANVYEAGYSGAADIPLTQAVSAGDVLVVSFWARAISGDGRGNAFVRARVESTANVISWEAPLTIGAAWRFVQVPVTMVAGYASGGARMRFHAGFGPQVLEIGGITAVDHGAIDYSTLGIPLYEGRELSAAWRAAAAARIETHRKADLTVQVRDLGGNPVPGATVRVKMKRHAFGFGSAVQGGRVMSTDTADAAYVANQTYRDKIKELFNWAVLENDLKWSAWEPTKDTVSPATALGALDWLRNNRMNGLRGHTLIWPDFSNMPGWVLTEYNGQITANGQSAADAWLRARVTSHIAGEASAVGARVDRWDVLNEPFYNHDLQDIYGRAEIVSWFQAARAAAPAGTALVLNDYNNHGEDLPHIAFNLRTVAETEAGQPTPLIDGIGIQSHFGTRNLPSPDRVFATLEGYAALGKQIEITEFDMDNTDEQLQADYLRDYLTICYSHPSVKSFLHWGFWAGVHWQPNRALYKLDWTPTLAAGVWNTLTRQTWWTDMTVIADAGGNATVRGFHGDYEISATSGSRAVTAATTLGPPGTTLAVIPRETRSVTLAPTADTYARDGSANAATIFGNTDPNQFMMKTAPLDSGFNRDGYLKFDLSSVPEVFSAKLRLSATLSVVSGSTAMLAVGVTVHAVPNTTWSEAILNWNNRPALGIVLDNKNVTAQQPTPTTQWIEFDVTDYLRVEKLAGRNVIALGLHNALHSSPLVFITSKEAANTALRPQLVITTALAPTVTLAATTPAAAEFGPVAGAFTASRTGDASIPLSVAAAFSGTATSETDFTAPTLPLVFPANSTTLTVPIMPLYDTLAEGPQTATLGILTGAAYTVGVPSSATVTLADLPIDNWRFGQFGAQANNSLIAGDLMDVDFDGIANRLEYYFGLPAAVANFDGLPIVQKQNIAGTDYLTLTFIRSKSAIDVSGRVQSGSGLTESSWTDIDPDSLVYQVDLKDNVPAPGLQTVTVRDTAPIGASPRFMRMKVTRP